jgi:hypothetical protein
MGRQHVVAQVGELGAHELLGHRPRPTFSAPAIATRAYCERAGTASLPRPAQVRAPPAWQGGAGLERPEPGAET